MILSKTCESNTVGLKEDEAESKLLLSDNSLSTLLKIIIYQHDGGVMVTDTLVSHLLNALPLKTDIDEA